MDDVRIVLADDHRLVRQGIRALLEADPEFKVVGEAGDGLEAGRLVQDLRPDLLLVDVRMPGLNGLEVARQAIERFPETRVLVLSMYDNESYVLQALRNGAAGYILKDCSATDLVRAIREVLNGQRYLSESISKFALEVHLGNKQGSTIDRYETLTPREREVFQLVAEGNTNAEIAEKLSISPRTVEIHRGNLMRKLGAKTYPDLIAYAVRLGIIGGAN